MTHQVVKEEQLREFYAGLTEAEKQTVLDASWQDFAKALCLWLFVSTMEFLAWITGHDNPWWTFFLAQGTFVVCIPTIYKGIHNAKEIVETLNLK